MGSLLEVTNLEATAGPQARNLHQTPDGRLVFFHFDAQSGGIVARLSGDGGKTWTAPAEHVVTAAGDMPPSVALRSGSTFEVTYKSTAGALAMRSFAVGSPGQPDTSSAERVVWTAGFDSSASTVSVAVRSAGPLGPRLAVGFPRTISVNPPLATFETSFSEDGGETWTPPIACETATDGLLIRGAVTTHGDDLLCLTQRQGAEGLRVRTLVSGAWTPAEQLATGVMTERAASTVATDDGRLHLVVGSAYGGATSVVYATRSTSGVWSGLRGIGTGTGPVLSTDGVRLTVLATEDGALQSSRRLRSYSTSDGITWLSGGPSGAESFNFVISQPAEWTFQPQGGDALFSFEDGEGSFGNRDGASLAYVPVDSAEKSVAFTFVPTTGQTVKSVRIWFSTSGQGHTNRRFRVGIQGDAWPQNRPSGTWVSELRNPVTGDVVTGSFGRILPSGGGRQSQVVEFGQEAPLTAGYRYHLVFDWDDAGPMLPGDSPPPDSSSHISPEVAWGTRSDNLQVRTHVDGDVLLGEPVWWAAWGIPRFQLIDSSGTVRTSHTMQPIEEVPAHFTSVPAESFVAPRTMTPDLLWVSLKKTGDPKSATFVVLFDAAGNELWSEGIDAYDGCCTFSLAGSGLVLTQGERYRLTVIDRTRDTANYWSLMRSGALTEDETFGGAASQAERSGNVVTGTDRTIEGLLDDGTVEDFVAFEKAGDALLVGDKAKFDSIRLVGGPLPATGTLSLEYWDGTSWRAVPNYDGERLRTQGVTTFDPPADWALSPIHDREAYWLAIRATTAAPIVVERITPMDTVAAPAVPARYDGALPFVATTTRADGQMLVRSQSHAPMHDYAGISWVQTDVLGESNVTPHKGPDGDFRPTLEGPVDGEFAIARASFSGAISTDAREGFRTQFGLNVLAAKPDGLGPGEAVYTVNGDAVYYTDVAPSTDLVVRPLAHSVKTFNVLWDGSAPESLSWRITSPIGATVDDPEAPTLILDDAGEGVVWLRSPWARDARGQQVPVDLRFEGGALITSIAHRGQGYAYPITVDPGFDRQNSDYCENYSPSQMEIFCYHYHTFRTRGFRMQDCIEHGNPCLAKNGNHKKEATAQAHAIRRLAKRRGNKWNELVIGWWLPENVDWESSLKDPAEKEWPDGDEVANWPCNVTTSSGRWRPDILVEIGDAYSYRYSIAEVKNITNAAEVPDQLACYLQHFINLGSYDDVIENGELNGSVHDGEDWFVYWKDPEDKNTKWYAWGAQGNDQRGHIYYGSTSNTPEQVKNRQGMHETGHEAIRGDIPARWFPIPELVGVPVPVGGV